MHKEEGTFELLTRPNLFHDVPCVDAGHFSICEVNGTLVCLNLGTARFSILGSTKGCKVERKINKQKLQWGPQQPQRFIFTNHESF